MAFQSHPMPPPGLAQQHMGPMHAHSAGPPMGQQTAQGMPGQMHPGMAGPNGPHGGQAGSMMGGLPPGMNPNAAHAMSHLQPQNQMFNNQQMPQGLPQQQQQQQAHQQQQAALIRQQQAAMAAHQQQQRAFMEQQARGMHNNPNMQGPPQGMTPQQMQHLQQQQAQLRQFNMPSNVQFQRQQMQNANMMNAQGAGGPGPPQMQPGPHAQPGQMRSQASMPSMPQGTQGGPLSDSQQQGQPNRPQDSSQGPGQISQGTPHQGRPPTAQQSQAQSNPMQRVPSSQPGQQPQPPQSQPPQTQNPAQTQGPQQNTTGQPQNPGLHVGVTQEQFRAHQENMRRTQLAQAQVSAQAQQIAQRQAIVQHQHHQLQSQTSHNGVVRLVQFADRLSGYNAESSLPDHDSWQRLVGEFFTEDALYQLHLWDDKNTQKLQYGIPQPILARYFMAQVTTGVQSISLSTGGATQRELPNGTRLVECQKATFTYLFPNNVQVKCEGPLRAVLGLSEKFELLDFDAVTHEEYISSARIRQLFALESPSSLTKSPKMSKTPAKSKQQQKLQQSRSITLSESDIPSAPVRSDGVTTGVKMFLENADTVAQMRDLFDFAQQQSQWSGSAALQNLVEMNQNGQAAANMSLAMGSNPQLNLPQNLNMNNFNQNGQAFRNPFPQGMPNFASPAHANLGLPNANNSPHMRTGGSPGHPGGMHGAMQPPMAPQMVAQHSAQGTSSSAAASSNASPNVHGKKRRASLAKGDGLDEGPHQVNGIGPGDQTKGKATQKPMGKRQKANG